MINRDSPTGFLILRLVLSAEHRNLYNIPMCVYGNPGPRRSNSPLVLRGITIEYRELTHDPISTLLLIKFHTQITFEYRMDIS